MSKYGDALDAMDQDRERQSATVANVAQRYNPDQYAQAITRGSELGVPARIVADNPQAFERKSKYGEALDRRDAPTTQEWLTNLDNAAVAQDDRENLAGLEKYLRSIRVSLTEAVRPVVDIERSIVGQGVKTPGTALSGLGRLFEAGGRYTERGVRALPGGDWLADTVGGTPWWMTPSEILKQPGSTVKKAGDVINVPKERQNLATDIAGGVGQLGAQVITQLLTGGAGGTASLFGQGADIMGDRAEAAGATPEQTDAAVLMGASITALTERYGLDALLNRVPPQIKNAVLSRLTDIAIGGGIEAAQEAVEGVLHNLTAKAVFDPNAPIFEGIDREAAAAGGAGAIARAVLGAIIPGRQLSFADQDRAAAEQIATVAQQSNLAVRSPEKLEELVSQIKAQTGSEFAYLDPTAFRTLYQSDQEAAQAAAELTGSPTTYFEAAVSNTKMAVPLEKYVARVAANKNAQNLIDHVTFTPDGMTAEEAKTDREILEGRAKEIAEREVTEARPDSSQAVYDDVLGQLIATGIERSTAEKNAALTQAVFRTLGQRTGIDAWQLYQRYGLKIQREGVTGGTQFDQAAFHGSPHSFDKFSLDKIGTGEGAQAYGWGLYFAENPEVASSYRTAGNARFPQVTIEGIDPGFILENSGFLVPDMMDAEDAGLRAGSPLTGEKAKGLITAYIGARAPDEVRRIRDLDANAFSMSLASGEFYQVDIQDEAVAKFLDWDKPLSKQPDSVRAAAAKLGITDASNGEDLYWKIKRTKYGVREAMAKNQEAARYASETLLSLGVPGIKYFDAGSRSDGDGTRNLVVFDDSLVTITHKNGEPLTAAEKEFFQRFNETRRGAIQFGTDRQFTISLLEKADLSTFLHESGHLYLEIMADLAEDANAPQQVKEDFAKILKWMGVKDRASIKTDQHEQWARGFEQYLMEGKAPSVEMQSVFARFRAWLVGIYRTLARLNVNLTDDVRRVMDRMVATDDEIAAAEESQNYAPIFTNAEEAGMSPEEWAAYKNIATRAHQEATEEMTDRFVKQLTREQKAWWKEERAKVRDEVLAEVNQQPVYRALAFLQKGTTPDGSALPEGIQAAKLNKPALVDKYGKDYLKRLPRGLTAKDGLSADVVASLFGFGSGDAMIEALANARPKSQLVEMGADARMREKYGDILTDGSIAEQAMQSVHTEGRAKVMAAELKALNRKRKEIKPFLKAAKDQATREQRQAREANAATLPDADELKAIKSGVQRIIQGKKVRDIQPNLYRVAEAKAARKAFEFASKGKYEEAYIEKRRQILNHELYRAAVKAREEVDGVVDYMRTFDKKATRERIAKAKGQYLEQIDALRERFDFSNVSNVADLKRDSLSKWVAEQEAAGREVNVPEYLLSEARKTPYKELLLAELQGLHDAVANIEHLAKTKDRLLKNRAAAEWDQAKTELLERVQSALPEGKDPPLGRFEQTRVAALAERGREIADSFLRPETIIEWLDGGTTGPWHDYLWNQANDSQDAREKLRDRVAKPLFELAQKIDRKRRTQLQEKVQIPSMGRALNRRTLVSIALNMGNESNLDKLKRGGYRTKDGSEQFTDHNLQEIKDALTKQDWQFIQTVWDTVNQLWPNIIEFQKHMGGIAPDKIEATPVQTKHGEFRGGYFPVVYDPAVSSQGEKQVAGDSVGEIIGGNFTRASTKKGYTESRTKVARPLLLDFERVVTRHLDQVITDLTHREFLLQALRILDDGELRAQIQNRIGEGAYRSLQGMVRHAVRADNYYGDPAASGWDKVQDYLIRNTAVAALGYRAVTAFGNLVLAPVQAAARIPPKQILKGVGEFYRSPKQMTAFIHDRSEFMKQRATNMDQTLVETMASLRGERSIRAQVARSAMAVHRWADFLGTHGLWLAKYREALETGATEEESIRQADKAIRQTQTAGAPKDLSAFERDPRYKPFRLFLGPMVIMGNRIRESIGRRGVVKSWPEAFGTLMAVWFIPAVLWEIATGKGPEDDDDDGILDDAALWALRKVFFYPFMTVPFLRDIASGIERKISGEYAPSRSVPLAEAGELVWRAGEEAYKAGAALVEGEEVDTEAVVKDFLRASGPLAGLPSGQLTVTGQYLYDVVTGEYDPEGVDDLRYLLVKREAE